MWSNRQNLHDAESDRARQHLAEPTIPLRAPGAHVVDVGSSPGALEWGAVSVRSLLLAKVEGKKGEKARRDVDASRGRMAACYVHAEGLRAVPQDCGKVSGAR